MVPEPAPVASRPVTPKIYTKKGDDGTTGLLYGGRVRKDSSRIELNGVVDEAQAAIGVARAETAPGSELERPIDRAGPRPLRADGGGGHRPGEPQQAHGGVELGDAGHGRALEAGIDDLLARFDMPSDFTIPGENRVAAALDLARTIVRRAERIAVTEPIGDGSLVMPISTGFPTSSGRWPDGRRAPSTSCPRPDAGGALLPHPPHIGVGLIAVVPSP